MKSRDGEVVVKHRFRPLVRGKEENIDEEKK